MVGGDGVDYWGGDGGEDGASDGLICAGSRGREVRPGIGARLCGLL